MMSSLSETLIYFQQRVYQKIPLFLPPVTSAPSELNHALHYVCEQPGKAIRPFLVYATGQLFETPYDSLDPVAIAVELIHLYSLIHDDLPSMDNDDLRRGRATCHKAFSESTAILVGDGLQTLAFQVLSDKEAFLSISAQTQLDLIHLLTKAVGISGMVKGQAMDTENVNQSLSEQELETMHLGKTGALIEACVHSAVLIGLGDSRDSHTISNLIHYARLIGLAFQIQDDVLDATGTTEALGKTANKDSLKNKPNFVSLLGLASAQQKAQHCIEQALACLGAFAPARAAHLIALTHYIIKREL